jgi:hypothetical protein
MVGGRGRYRAHDAPPLWRPAATGQITLSWSALRSIFPVLEHTDDDQRGVDARGWGRGSGR